MSASATLGFCGAAIVGVSAVYYVVDILRGHTRPQRTSWTVWAVVGLLGFGTARSGGAGPGAWASGVDALAAVLTVGLALSPRYGKAGGRRIDPYLGVLALSGVVLWRWGPLTSGEAAICAVAFDLPALWPTAREAWLRPRQESLLSWAADTGGHVCALLAVQTMSLAALTYPLYTAGSTALVAALLVNRRRRRVGRHRLALQLTPA